MRSLPLVWRFFLPCGALLLTTSAVTAWLLVGRLQADQQREQLRGLERTTLLLGEVALPTLRGEVAHDLQARLRSLGGPGQPRLTVIRADGRVLADTETGDPAALQPHGTEREELREALAEPFGRARRLSDSTHVETDYVARHLAEGPRALGWVRAARATSDARADSSHLAHVLLGTTLGSLAVGLAAALVLARRLARPLRSLTQAAGAMAAGEYGRRVHVVGGGREVAELAAGFNRMAAELEVQIRAAREERRELEAVLAGMVEGVLAVDAGERVVLMNTAGAAILGIDPTVAHGRPLWEVVRLREVTETLAAALRDGRPRASEIRRPGRPRDRVLRLHASPLGGAGGAVLVFHDITELRQLEQVRRDFVANASHELKTPLAAIRGLVETILDDEAMDAATQRRFLGSIQAQSERLTALVEEMLALSRLEGAGHALERVRVDLREPVGQALEALRPVAAERRITIREDLPAEPVEVQGEREALRRVAANLLDNALKYTPTGGEVAVRVYARGGRGLLEVADSGPGIAPAERERVFERFYRIDKGRGRDSGGTGLGLAIVKHLVLALDGQVSVLDSPQGGALLRVDLPEAL